MVASYQAVTFLLSTVMLASAWKFFPNKGFLPNILAPYCYGLISFKLAWTHFRQKNIKQITARYPS